MSIIKQTGESLMKYGGIIVNKTEAYARIAKLKLDIKRLESSIEQCYIKAGRLATNEYRDGAAASQSDIKNIAEEVNRYNEEIAAKKQEIAEIKAKDPDAVKADETDEPQTKE